MRKEKKEIYHWEIKKRTGMYWYYLKGRTEQHGGKMILTGRIVRIDFFTGVVETDKSFYRLKGVDLTGFNQFLSKKDSWKSIIFRETVAEDL